MAYRQPAHLLMARLHVPSGEIGSPIGRSPLDLPPSRCPAKGGKL